MQALQYTRTLTTIVQEMKSEELLRFIDPLLRGSITLNPQTKDQFSSFLFTSRAGYERLLQDPPTAKVLHSLRIGEIYEPARLGRLINAVATAQNAAPLQLNSEFVEFYALVQSLVTVQQSCSQLLEKEKLLPAKNLDELLELQLVDYDGTGIEAPRLERFVLLLRQLHTNFARIFDIKGDHLIFVYFDSGSDLVVALQCAKVILDAIKNLLGEWWDRIRFREFETFEKKMAAVSQGLSVATAVQEAVEKQVLDQEAANLLKTRVIREVDRLIGLGVSLPLYEMENLDQRQLLLEKRDTKLLGSGTPPEDADSG